MSQDEFSPQAFGVFVRRAGFALTPEQLAEYQEAYGHIVAMARLIRAPLSPSLDYMAEPAHTFAAAPATLTETTP